ncbi:hypothetical protein RRG08_038697 [Elysia crispata]|uniref:Uncharacterized protein n=1 Tax=Elysia crispata TaxID=231223 RepID=A0AAE0ZK13_9GAST|nr:hypothetical protein RRG08_038697 [Elysia crispata]
MKHSGLAPDSRPEETRTRAVDPTLRARNCCYQVVACSYVYVFAFSELHLSVDNYRKNTIHESTKTTSTDTIHESTKTTSTDTIHESTKTTSTDTIHESTKTTSTDTPYQLSIRLQSQDLRDFTCQKPFMT